MRKAAFVFLLVCYLLLASCSSNPESQATLTPGEPASLTSPTTLFPTSTITSTPLPTSTETPVPFSPMISAQNASRLVEVGRIGKGAIRQVAWSPSGDYLALATSTGVYIYSIEHLLDVNFIDAPTGVNAVTFGADDSILIAAVSTPDNTIKVFNPLTGELLSQLGNQAALDLSYSLSIYSSGQIAFWDVNIRQMVYSIELPYAVPSLELTPNGYYLLSNSLDGIIRIWGIEP